MKLHVTSKTREKRGKSKIFLEREQRGWRWLVEMSLWVDKYRPSSLSKLDYHKDQAKWLTRLVSSLARSKRN